MGNINDSNSSRYLLDQTHKELKDLLYKLSKGYMLSEAEFNELRKKGVLNLSTFSGDYNDLINKPDFSGLLSDMLSRDDLETTSTVQAKLNQLLLTFNEQYERIDNGLRKDMHTLEIELYEYLREALLEQNIQLTNLIEEWAVALSIDLENALNDKMIQHENEYDEKIQRILDVIEEPPTYIAPTLSLSVSNKVEHNVPKELTITPNFKTNDAGAVVSYTLKRGQDILVQSTGLTSYKEQLTLSHGSTATYVATVEYAEGPVKNSNLGNPMPDINIKAGQITSRANVNAYANSYYGAIDAEDVTEADIINMSKISLTSKGYTAIYNLNASQRSVFMYPSNYGTLSSIKDANNFDYIDSYKLTKMIIDEVEYNVYILKDPVKINNFKQIFA